MNILMLLVKPFREGRARKEASALVAQNHNIYILAREMTAEQEVDTILSKVIIERLPKIINPRISHFLTKPFFFNPFYLIPLLRILYVRKIDVIHVHDLPLAPLSVIIGRIWKVGVVFDLHENFPAMLRLEAERRSAFFRFLLKINFFERLELFALKHADLILVVCDEQRQRVVDLGIKPYKVMVLGNTLDIDAFQKNQTTLDANTKDNFSLFYMGSLTEGRGLETAIQAMPIILQRIPDCKLIIVGDGSCRSSLEKLAHDLGIDPAVKFPGWVNRMAFPSLIADSHVCLIPHDTNDHINFTYPKKLFEYMYLGKPLLVSDAPPLKRIVCTEAKAGLAFKSGDSEDFSSKVFDLHDHPEEMSLMGQRGRNLVQEKYNWDVSALDLLNAYSRVFSSNGHEPFE